MTPYQFAIGHKHDGYKETYDSQDIKILYKQMKEQGIWDGNIFATHLRCSDLGKILGFI